MMYIYICLFVPATSSAWDVCFQKRHKLPIAWAVFLEIYFFFFFFLFILPQSRTYTPGTYKPNARGSDVCRGSNSVWTTTLDRYTRTGLPECVVSTISGPPPKITQDRTQTKDTLRIPRQKLKFLTPPGWKAGTLSTTPRRWKYLSIKVQMAWIFIITH